MLSRSITSIVTVFLLGSINPLPRSVPKREGLIHFDRGDVKVGLFASCTQQNYMVIRQNMFIIQWLSIGAVRSWTESS